MIRPLSMLGLLAACAADPGPPAEPDGGADASLDDAGDAAVGVDAATPPPLLRVDGSFDDWAGRSPLALDPEGDATGGFDVTELDAQSQGALLYLRFDVGTRRNLNAGDAEDGTLTLRLGLPDGQVLAIDHRALDPRLDGRALIWDDLDYEAAPTHSASVFELSMDLSLLGVAPGETITLDFDGSDRLAEPAAYVLSGEAQSPVIRSTERVDGTSVRIASLNVHKSGLLPGRRLDPLLRLLRAAGADIYCLQEEYDLTLEELAALFETIDAGPWYVHKVRDNVIASRHPIVPFTGLHERYAVAGVDVPGHGPLLIVGLHLSCCGWEGNLDDSYRIDEAGGVVDTIQNVRDSGDPTFGAAPVVVVGDWNLVGSRTPLDLVTDPQALGLEQWLLPQLVGEHVMTWRPGASFFPPGILDLVAHSPELVRGTGFVVDERRLPDELRDELGLLPEDGLATDHSLVVADFTLP